MTHVTAPQHHIDPYHARLHRLKYILTWMAAAVAGAVAISIPAIFFLTAYTYESMRMEQAAEGRAQELSTFIYKHPDLWRFNAQRLEQFLQPRSGDGGLYQMIGLDGEIIASSRPTVEEGAVQRSHGLSIEGVAPVFEGQKAVGAVHVIHSLSPILTATGGIVFLGFMLALAIFVTLRTLPLRALQERVAEMKENEQILQTQIASLGEAHHKLEMQGESLTRLADNLRVARDAAEASNRSKSEFLANMSHELRTPLNAVIGFSDMMRNELLGPINNPQYLSYADDIHSSGVHLLGLINDILDISKIESGEMELFEEPVDIAQIVRSSLTLVKTRAEGGGVKLENDATNPLPALFADARKIKQIVINLLSNAVKFTPADGTVRIAAAIEDDGSFSIMVKDTGIGIAPQDIERVLNPFIQADSSLSRKYEGTGLGLPLTKALIEMHQGRFTLTSEKGVGTEAIMRFPASRIVAGDEKDDLSVVA